MCNHDDRQTLFAMQAIEEFENTRTTGRVEISRRLISKEEFRIVRERTCNCNSLPLAYRQSLWQMIGSMLHSNKFKQTFRLRGSRRARATTQTLGFVHFQSLSKLEASRTTGIQIPAWKRESDRGC